MKKRYSVTLSEEKAEKIKSCIKELKVRPAVFSECLDDQLILVLSAFEECVQKKRQGESYSLSDAIRRAASDFEPSV